MDSLRSHRVPSRRPPPAARGPDRLPPRWDPWTFLFFGFGLILSLLMVARSQVAGDQLLLLARGWKLAFRGEWVFLGMPMSGGGYNPGGLTSLLVGLPLALWSDHRSPTVLVLLSHVVAYLLLDALIRKTAGNPERRAFAVLFWLNPWRLYHSAFLWTPNLLVLLGALHLWTAFELREKRRFWLSFLHVLLLGCALQIHPSTVLLVAVSLVLLIRGYLRLYLRGAIWAALAVLASLIPWYRLVILDPSLLPLRAEGSTRLLQPLVGLLRGSAYWLRYPSFSLSGTISCLDFSDVMGPAAWKALRPTIWWTVTTVGPLSLALPLWSHGRHWRGAWRRRAIGRSAPRSGRARLRGIISWSFLASLAVFLISPTTIMSWQVLSLFPAAILLVVLQLGPLLRRRRRGVVRRLTHAWVAAAFVLCLAVAFGSPHYRQGGERCGSRHAIPPALSSDHALFDDLGLREAYGSLVNQPGGWWPEVLEQE